jgi:hypothetical protein
MKINKLKKNQILTSPDEMVVAWYNPEIHLQGHTFSGAMPSNCGTKPL